jgi:hypothetical protein
MMHRAYLVLLFLASTAGWAEEAVVTLRSTVTGSQEQPKVMYLLPWQQPGDAEFEYHMQGSFADELFVPLDRDEFVRGLEYQALLADPQVTDVGAVDSPDE